MQAQAAALGDVVVLMRATENDASRGHARMGLGARRYVVFILRDPRKRAHGVLDHFLVEGRGCELDGTPKSGLEKPRFDN